MDLTYQQLQDLQELPGHTMNVVVLALVKNNEKYIFLYTPENYNAVIQHTAKFASREDLSFNWYDAACLAQKVREEHNNPTKLNIDEVGTNADIWDELPFMPHFGSNNGTCDF